jgi:hypothetical protein
VPGTSSVLLLVQGGHCEQKTDALTLACSAVAAGPMVAKARRRPMARAALATERTPKSGALAARLSRDSGPFVQNRGEIARA